MSDIYTVSAEQLLAPELDVANSTTDELSLVTQNNAAYYRSRILSSRVGLNQLVNVAEPILTLLPRLQAITVDNTKLIQENLSYEFAAFNTRMQSLTEDQQYIDTATTLLQGLCNTLLHEAGRPAYFLHLSDDFCLLKYINNVLQTPQQDQSLLEMSYICLSLWHQQDQQVKINQLSEQLYNKIATYPKPETNSGQQTEIAMFSSPVSKSWKKPVALRHIILGLLTGLLALHFALQAMQNMNMAPLEQNLTQLDATTGL